MVRAHGHEVGPMRWWMAATACAIATLSGPGARAQTEEQRRVAVMSIENRVSGELPERLLDDLSEALRIEVARSGRYIVIDKSRQSEVLRRMVKESKKESYAECYDTSCQIPLGRALSADTILRASLTRLGATYLLNLEMIDLATEALVPGTAASVEVEAEPKSGREERLLEGVRRAVRQVLQPRAAGQGVPAAPPIRTVREAAIPAVNKDTRKARPDVPGVPPNGSAADKRPAEGACTVIRDPSTGLEWLEGPDRDTNWKEARAWVDSLARCGAGWRLPSLAELAGLYRKGSGTRNMRLSFSTTGWYVWSAEPGSGFSFYSGRSQRSDVFDSGGKRVFAVRESAR